MRPAAVGEDRTISKPVKTVYTSCETNQGGFVFAVTLTLCHSAPCFLSWAFAEGREKERRNSHPRPHGKKRFRGLSVRNLRKPRSGEPRHLSPRRQQQGRPSKECAVGSEKGYEPAMCVRVCVRLSSGNAQMKGETVGACKRKKKGTDRKRLSGSFFLLTPSSLTSFMKRDKYKPPGVCNERAQHTEMSLLLLSFSPFECCVNRLSSSASPYLESFPILDWARAPQSLPRGGIRALRG